MKRDFLLQLTFQDGSKLSKAAVDAILDEHGRELEQLKRGYSEYPQLKKELEQAKAQVAAFMALKPQKLFEQMDADEKRIAYLESLNAEALQESVKNWQEKYDSAVTRHTQEQAQLRFDHALELAVLEAGGRNQKAIAALLDIPALQASEDPKTAVRDAVRQLKSEQSYLFLPQAVPFSGGAGAFTPQEAQPVTLAGALREKLERK